MLALDQSSADIIEHVTGGDSQWEQRNCVMGCSSS